MTISVSFDKPEGFDKWFSETLADCVAKGIVEAAIQRVHKNNAVEAEIQEVVSRE